MIRAPSATLLKNISIKSCSLIKSLLIPQQNRWTFILYLERYCLINEQLALSLLNGFFASLCCLNIHSKWLTFLIKFTKRLICFCVFKRNIFFYRRIKRKSNQFFFCLFSKGNFCVEWRFCYGCLEPCGFCQFFGSVWSNCNKMLFSIKGWNNSVEDSLKFYFFFR